VVVICLGVWCRCRLIGSDGKKTGELSFLVANLSNFSVLTSRDFEPKFTDRAAQVGGLAFQLGGGLLHEFFGSHRLVANELTYRRKLVGRTL